MRFTDIARAAGINFNQDATSTDQKYYLETMGTGLGWVDYDQDGLMDLVVVDGTDLTDAGDLRFDDEARTRVYHNDGGLRFSDATKSGRFEPWWASMTPTQLSL